MIGKFQRIQCTPDLLPTDITGTNIWNPREVMEETQVTVDGVSRQVPTPFFAIA
jgi:MoxR-like ATPase